jgi:hypothetical protein
MIELNGSDLEQVRQYVIDFEKKVKLITQDHYTPSLSRKKLIELSHAGKFLALLDPSSKIVEMSDSPDFRIEIGGNFIGLELVRIFKEENVEEVQSRMKLFSDAGEIFRNNFPTIKVHAQFYLTDEPFKIEKVQAASLKEEIVRYTYNYLTGHPNNERPNFIENVYFQQSSETHFIYNPGAYDVDILTEEKIVDIIEKKSARIERYVQNSHLSLQWLLIVINSLSPDSYESQKNYSLLHTKSKFNAIFLLEDFNAKILRLK